MDKYVPGVCNIGPAERKKRRMTGYLGTMLLIILWVTLLILGGLQIYKLLLFFPAFMSALGFIQDRLHFCAGFGVLGVYNFGSDSSKKLNVEQTEMLKKDKVQAWKIIGYSFFTAAIVTLIGYLL